jgi:hypothetical protein
MKTNNLKKRSLFTTLLTLLTVFNPEKRGIGQSKIQHSGGVGWNPQAIYTPRHTMFKGWMREKRRSTFNKTK